MQDVYWEMIPTHYFKESLYMWEESKSHQISNYYITTTQLRVILLKLS